MRAFLFRLVLRRVQFPPEFFAEVLRLTADAFEVIQILRRDFFQHGAEVRHRHRGEAVLLARIVEVALEEPHQLAPLRLALPPLGRLRRLLLKIRQQFTNGLHYDQFTAQTTNPEP